MVENLLILSKISYSIHRATSVVNIYHTLIVNINNHRVYDRVKTILVILATIFVVLISIYSVGECQQTPIATTRLNIYYTWIRKCRYSATIRYDSFFFYTKKDFKYFVPKTNTTWHLLQSYSAIFKHWAIWILC